MRCGRPLGSAFEESGSLTGNPALQRDLIGISNIAESLYNQIDMRARAPIMAKDFAVSSRIGKVALGPRIRNG